MLDRHSPPTEAAARLVEAAPQAIVLFDDEGRYAYLNARARELLSIPFDSLIGCLPLEVFPVLAETPFDIASRAIIATRERQHVRAQKGPSGRVFEFELVPLDTGHAMYLTDVSDRAADERAREESEHWHRQLFQAHPIPLFIVDPDTRGYVDVNAAAIARYGFTRDEFLRMRTDDLRPPSELSEFLARIAATPPIGEHRGEYRHRTKQGRILAAEVVANDVWREGRHLRIVAAIDISERAAAEAARRSGEARLAAIVDSATDGIISVNERQEVVVFNPAAERIFGRPAAEAMGSPLSRFIPERFRIAASFSLTTREPQSRGAHARRSESRLSGLRADGTEFALEATVSEIVRDGERLHTLILRDVTERSALEEQLRQAQKMEAVGQLAGGVAHDFNNLLTVIIAATEFALQRTDEDDPRRADLADIQTASDRAARLTKQLLVFSRQRPSPPRPVDVNAVVEEAQKLLRRIVREDMALHTQLAPSLPVVLADPVELEQSLVNLVVNARDAMPTGGAITIRTRLVELSPDEREAWQAEAANGTAPMRCVEISVIDSGIGMDEETRARVFEPFFTTKSRDRGTGLGLSTVYGIVRHHGGAIRVQSTLGAGSTFTMLFPVSATPLPALGGRVRSSSSPARPRGGETILLVEDEPLIRVRARRALEGRGYRVLEAGDGEEALSVAEGHDGPIDLVVTDVVMPRLGGPALMSRLRARRPGVPALFVSGYPSDLTTGARLGDDTPFLAKPFSIDELEGEVRQLLDAESDA